MLKEIYLIVGMFVVWFYVISFGFIVFTNVILFLCSFLSQFRMNFIINKINFVNSFREALNYAYTEWLKTLRTGRFNDDFY